MKTFRMEILSTSSVNPSAHSGAIPGDFFDDVVSYTGRDSSGSFGILAHAERRMTVLVSGLASFRRQNGQQEYLALPGGTLYFRDNVLSIVTQNYVRDSDFGRITRALDQEIRNSEARLTETKKSLRRLDEEILRRLSRLNWRTEA